MLGGQRDDQMAMNYRQRTPRDNQAAIWRAREVCDCALDLVRVAHVDWAHLQSERRRHCLDGAELTEPGRDGGVPKDGRPRYPRRDLLEQFQPFSTDAVFELDKSGGVAARPRQTINEAGTNWIGDNHKHDRYSARGL